MPTTVVRHWWGHFVYGSTHVAWCNICDEAISSWTQGFGSEAMPAAQRKKVTDHKATHPEVP